MLASTLVLTAKLKIVSDQLFKISEQFNHIVFFTAVSREGRSLCSLPGSELVSCCAEFRPSSGTLSPTLIRADEHRFLEAFITVASAFKRSESAT